MFIILLLTLVLFIADIKMETPPQTLHIPDPMSVSVSLCYILGGLFMVTKFIYVFIYTYHVSRPTFR